ncbi:hypothetical protein BDR26DRAFT_871079 [Obelidium mucronatum]|nr:hypothetical protein BDR26DRAFT_871079 [Obelidium mucronatum]
MHTAISPKPGQHEHHPQQQRPEAVRLQTATIISQQPTNDPNEFETFYGFIKTRQDAETIVEACVQGILRPIHDLSVSCDGTVICFSESSAVSGVGVGECGQKMRWRDGLNWSSSRISGPFLLYRQVESQQWPQKVQERDSLFSTTSLRANTRVVVNGLAKRTMAVVASNGVKYRIINYFYPYEVEEHYSERLARGRGAGSILRTPSEVPELSRLQLELSANYAAAGPQASKGVTKTTSPVSLSSPSPSPHYSSGISLCQRFDAVVVRNGGYSMRPMINYFRMYPNWADCPVRLAPITQHPGNPQLNF